MYFILCGGLTFMHLLVTYTPWIGSVLVELVLIGTMLKRESARRFPCFFAAVSYDVLRQFTLAAIAWVGPRDYFYAYWISIPLEYTLALAVLGEVFKHVFYAHISYSPKVIALFIVSNIVLVAVCAYLAFHPDIPVNNLAGLALTLNRSVQLSMCGALLLLWVFAARLGISWRHHILGIVLGFAIYSAASLIVAAVHALTGNMCSGWLTPITPFSYLAATIIWTAYLRREEPARGPLTLSELSAHSERIATYRKILAEIWRRLSES